MLGRQFEGKLRAVEKDWTDVPRSTQVERVLRILADGEFAVFLSGVEVWEHHGINCGMMDEVMYGMMPKAKKSSNGRTLPR